jgi:hypothetical protein
MWLGSPPPRRDRGGDRRSRRQQRRPARLSLTASLISLTARLAWFLLVPAVRLAVRAAPYAAAAALIAALWPVVTVATAAAAAAWAAGLHPVRLLRIAAGSLVMPAACLAAAARSLRPWASPARLHAWEAQPWAAYRAATLALFHVGHHPAAGFIAGGFPFTVTAGIAAAAGWWAWRSARMANGLGGRTAYAPVAFDARQWRRQARTARRDARAPGRVRLTGRRGVPVGVTIRAVSARWTRVLTIPAAEFGRHMVIVGGSGSGKTTLMIRLWAGWFAAALRAAGKGEPSPLLIVIDAKGGHDSRDRAAQTAAALHAAGAGRVAVWPDDAALSLWDIAPRDLAVLLHQLIESGEGSAAYYADMSAAVIRLAVCAPAGPPRSAAEFLDRLNAEWLARAWSGGSQADRSQALSAARHVPDIAMRYAQLLDRLGPALDGDGSLTDPDIDAWYCILEGTAEPSVAEAQAMALTELAARAAVTPDGPPRTILLAADDYSAVSRRVPLSNLYDRGRSLGLGVMVSAQSWEGLGADDDERKRITSTADGGVWLLRTPDPDPLTALAGSVERLASGRKLTAPGTTGDEGNSRVQHMWAVQPNRVRQFRTGQAVWIRHGSAVYVHVVPAPHRARTPAAPAPARQPAAPPAWPVPPSQGSGPHEDDVLGPGNGPYPGPSGTEEEAGSS